MQANEQADTSHSLAKTAASHREQERFADALACLETLLALDESNGEVLGAIGHCHLMLSQQANEVHAALHQLHLAHAAYQKALQHLKDIRDPDIWYGVGLLYDRLSSLLLPGAEQTVCLRHTSEALTAVISIAPSFGKIADVVYRLGLTFKALGETAKALECMHARSN